MTDRDSSYGGKQPLRYKHCLGVVVAFVCLLASALGCSTKRNDGASRFYHNLTTRYNVYHNGKIAFDQGYQSLYRDLSESYTELLVPDPVTRTGEQSQQAEQEVGGALGKAIEKGQKAIRKHSIRTKPKMSREELLRSPKKKAFYNKTEYNPFLHNAWMMVGEAQFYAGRFMEAMATFSYMTRLYGTEPKIRDEARIWQARCYTALGWIDEAREILDNLPEEGSYEQHSKVYPLAEAELALKEGDTLSTISYLQQAIARKPIKAQRARLYYLLGQLYSKSQQWSEAKRAFGRVIRLAPPYPLEFAATMRQLEIDAQTSPQQAIQRLDRLARRDKNKDLLDQIYLTEGRLYLEMPDTMRAVAAFTKGVDKSTQRSFDYMLCQLHLGEIYLAQSNYLKAQEAYAGASGVIEKTHPRYEAVTKLSADLDQLVSFAEQVHEQDSLRRIAALPEAEQIDYADSLITAYKKAQEEARKQELLAEQQGQNEALNQQADINMPGGGRSGGGVTPPSMAGGGNGKSYFYNPTLVAQGKDLFERKWGKRPLADDWRRRNKQISFDPSDPTATDMSGAGELSADSLSTPATDGVETATDSLPADQDPLQRAYYLSKLPTTPEQIAASDEIIQTALVGMGEAFNEQMERFEESIHTYEDLLKRYPEYKDRAAIYYTLYMLYQRLERPDLAEPWRGRLLSELPEDPLAVTLQDPNYIAKLRANIGADERLYSQAFDAYLAGKPREVQRLYRETAESYPLSETLPQFAFVHALSYVLHGDEASFRASLQSLTASYPKAEVSILAQEMLERLLRGAHIAQGGYQGIAWDLRLASQDSVAGALADQPFTVGKRSDKHQALLIVPQRGEPLERALRFAVESFNYAQFTDYILPVSFLASDHETLLTISDLPSAPVAWQYLAKGYSPEGYLSAMDSTALLLVMTEGNYQQITSGAKSIGDYITFVADSLVELHPEGHYMIDRWLVITGDDGEETAPADTLQTVTTPAVDTPITFDIDRTQLALTPIELALDSLLELSTEMITPTEDQRMTIQQARPLTPAEVKQLEKERKAQERQAKKEREEQLKERERQRDAELKARRDEQRRQEQLRKEQIKRVEAERRAQEKARKEQLRQREKERQQRLKELEAERRRKLKERQAQQK